MTFVRFGGEKPLLLCGEVGPGLSGLIVAGEILVTSPALAARLTELRAEGIATKIRVVTPEELVSSSRR